jgi:ParB family transcriptional regulator, chromosome partitioning protein
MPRKNDSSPDRKPAVSSPPRRRLGRGLSSLISSPVPVPMSGPARADPSPSHDDVAAESPRSDGDAGGGRLDPDARQATDHLAALAPEDRASILMVAIEQIQPSRHQPRQHFDEAGLESLAASIRTAGVMQPIILRPAKSLIDTGRYELIAGERRWRAAQRAGLDRVPAVVRDIDDATAAEWALIENIQREDLNPIERAEAFRRLCDGFSLTHQEIADRVGLDRSSVSNLLRLLELDSDSMEDVRGGRLSLGHARALLAVANISARRKLAAQAISHGWSVRALEQRIRAAIDPTGKSGEETSRAPSATQIHLQHLADELGRHLGTRVDIRPGRKKGAGQLIIDFYSLDEFESLLSRLGYQPT